MQHQADVELARRAADADPVAFETLFSDLIDRVHRFVLRRTASAEAAQRVCERALTRSFESLDRYDGGVPLSAWVLSIVKQELRSEARAPRTPAPSSTLASPPVSGG